MENNLFKKTNPNPNLEGTEEELDNELLGETSAPEQEGEIPQLNNTPNPNVDADAEPEAEVDVEIEVEGDDLIEEEPEVVTETEEVQAEPTDNPFSTDFQATKTFTQSQVDEIAGKTRVDTRDKTFRYIYGRYGVNNEDELDELVGKGQRFELLQEEYDNEKREWNNHNSARDAELSSIKEQIALMQSGIDSNRYEDAKFILKGKGLDITSENIERELGTHPEWKKALPETTSEHADKFIKTDKPSIVETPKISKLSVLGNDKQDFQGESEEEYALNKIFKV
jgi:hypothetical protein